MELVILGSGSKNTHLVDRGQATLFQEDRERGFGWFEITAHHIHGELVDEHGQVDFVRDVER
ncbi:MAG: hypothetical protein GXP62_21975 [Oligoflexia bacterium]|nr:hypothetical protein [Oligoflexia bacterium]